MHWLFICSTGLRFLSAVAMIEEQQQKMKEGDLFDVDLVLIRRRRETLRIAEVLDRLECFRETYILESESISSLKHLLKNPENALPRLLKRFSLTQHLARKIQFGSSLSLDFERYTDFFAVNRSDACLWILSHLSDTCRIHHFEDGIGTYTNNKLLPEERDFYLFDPELSTCDPNKVKRIKRLSFENRATRTLVRALCSKYPAKFPPVLYVDQYWGANALRSSHASDLQRAMWNKRIELIDAVVREEGIGRCGILIHPASKPDEVQFLRERYGEEAVLDLNGVPLEMYFLSGEHCPEKIYTVSSSAAFYWKIACDIQAKVKMVFLVHSFQFDYRGLTTMPTILEKLRQRYPDLVEIR